MMENRCVVLGKGCWRGDLEEDLKHELHVPYCAVYFTCYLSFFQ